MVDGNIIHEHELAEAFELDIHDLNLRRSKPLKMAEKSTALRVGIKLLHTETPLKIRYTEI
ncbi:DUF2525 domain-containing protein [Salmonella enterica subsp. enterica]|nr:DUF2525 domain-containing protein [Salmonella enterica subsp. enterica]